MCITIAFPSVLCLLGFPSLICCNIFIYLYLCVYLYSTNGLNGVICRPTDFSLLSPVSDVCISLWFICMPQKPVPSFWEHSNELYGFIKGWNFLIGFKVWGFDGGVCSHNGLLVVTPHSLCCGYQHFGRHADPIFWFKMSRIREPANQND